MPGLIYLFIYLFLYIFKIFGCVGSSFLCEGFLQLRQAGATVHRGARASHHRGLSCFGAQAQQLWLTGPAAPRHVGSSQTRARTRVSCISRQTLNHCATREAPGFSSFLRLNKIFHDFPFLHTCIILCYCNKLLTRNYNLLFNCLF